MDHTNEEPIIVRKRKRDIVACKQGRSTMAKHFEVCLPDGRGACLDVLARLLLEEYPQLKPDKILRWFSPEGLPWVETKEGHRAWIVELKGGSFATKEDILAADRIQREYLQRLTSQGYESTRPRTPIGLQTLAKCLRMRLVLKGMMRAEKLNAISDESIIDSYITCNCCKTKIVSLEEALQLTDTCATVDEWLLATSGGDKHIH